MGLKPDDDLVLPLSPELHKLQHQIGEKKFWLNFPAEYPDSYMRMLQDFARLYHLKYLRCTTQK